MTDIFREVDEDIRNARYLKLWKRYGRYVVGAAALVVLATAGTVAWRDYDASQQEGRSAAFSRAMTFAESGAHGAALTAFGNLAEQGGAGYGVLARFQQAAALIATGARVDAVAVYDGMAADGSVAPLLRDLAAFYAALHLMDTAESSELERRLDPLTGDDNPWRYSARELTALVALRAGQTENARILYKALVDDPVVPPAMRARAAELLSSLGGPVLAGPGE